MTNPRRMTTRLSAAFLALAALTASCSDEPTADQSAPVATTTAAPATTDPDATAPATTVEPGAVAASGTSSDGVLPPGTHVGIAWFAPPAPGTEDRAMALWEEANAEATIGRVQTDWIDVEPSEGDYDFADLDDQLRAISDRGALPMVTIAAVDVSGTPFPEWLGGFEPERAADAYARMLEAAAPMFEEHGVWLIAVANEPPLEDDLDIPEFTRFVAGVEQRADRFLPDVPVTFVFAGGDALKSDPATRELAAAVDVFSVNHYCIQADLLVTDPADIQFHLDAATALAGDKPVVFQEFGCPASEALGSNEDFQAAWFEDAFAAIHADDQVIAAYVFEFGNWSSELVALDYAEAFAAEPGLDWLYERVAEWLQTSGLIRPDGTTRPAWDVYLSNLGG